MKLIFYVKFSSIDVLNSSWKYNQFMQYTVLNCDT